eukprot:449285-Ditylum_brightwellii.AAC.1
MPIGTVMLIRSAFLSCSKKKNVSLICIHCTLYFLSHVIYEYDLVGDLDGQLWFMLYEDQVD